MLDSATSSLPLTRDSQRQSPSRSNRPFPFFLNESFVRIEVATPHQIRTHPQPLRICCGVHDSPLGACFIAATDRAICRMELAGNLSRAACISRLRSAWGEAAIEENNAATAGLVDRVFSCTRKSPSRKPVHLLLRGTDFQVQVWRALLAIPAAQTSTYQAIADSIGRPRATRAVGGAIGANPIAWLIPCHRVLRSNGELGGYRWGIEMKRTCLNLDRALSTIEE